MFAERMRLASNLYRLKTKRLEVPLLDVGPTDTELAVILSSETICMEETILDVAPTEDIIVDTFEYIRYADGLPDHLINISGLIDGLGNQPKSFLTAVKANMYVEGSLKTLLLPSDLKTTI